MGMHEINVELNERTINDIRPGETIYVRNADLELILVAKYG